MSTFCQRKNLSLKKYMWVGVFKPLCPLYTIAIRIFSLYINENSNFLNVLSGFPFNRSRCQNLYILDFCLNSSQIFNNMYVKM